MIDPTEVINRLSELADAGDPEYQKGGWLEWEPKVNDVQLAVFETMLSLGVSFFQSMKDDQCGHDACAVKGMSESPFNSLLPPTTVLAIIRELQMRRSLDAMTANEPLNWEGGSRSYLPIERHGDMYNRDDTDDRDDN